MRARWTIVLLGVGGCADGAALGRIDPAITNGADDGADPAVVALLDASGQPYCTGTLIAPEAVLTAAHCLDGEPPEAVYFGATPGAGGARVAVAQARQHPGYDPGTLASDVAVLRLAGPPAVAPAPVFAEPFDASFVGRAIRVVGFGRAGTLDAGAPRKRSGQTRIRAFGPRDFSFAAAPAQTCFGDSGGPAFAQLEGQDFLIGVTSSGDFECMTGGTDARVDASTVAFVRDFLTHGRPAPSAQGGCSVGGRAVRPTFRGLALLGILVARRRVRPLRRLRDGGAAR